MFFYKKLSQISFLSRSYAFKFLFVAFIGIHIPLIGLLFLVLYGNFSFSPNEILIFALLMTLFASGVTLAILKHLIKPIEIASKALRNYKKERQVPNLPLNFHDEAGFLMRNIQETILEHERFIVEKQDLVYLLSHDLKTFAGQPQSLATLILEADPSDEIKELAELIYQSSNQQFLYIENFLKLLKEQDEIVQSSPGLKMIEFTSMISTVEKLVQQLLIIKKIKLNVSIDIQKDELLIEEELLIRVLVNLIDNAIKFSYPNSEVNLRIYKENTKLVFCVSDNGIGFNHNQTEELFKKFTKMSKLGTSNEGSTGIGLYLCRKIVEKNQGQLNASSEGQNRGSTFTVIF
ncbi:Histidine kinase-, DNA gyrase B-, and HSP90-like ATPase [Flavobacterium gillisiae]|uniref:histidine kinase n=1 Tax=Flavobacterium gillisiae TaxID=150146 RepID=A0A1H4API8_9FLAO|nr:HAMP domain-containing sensor histidine kinase [Flavobacterium gillisiae]SEA37859.1 Histidine kinase-, DNA gyrase B-, and HSP90-like ATPase [Flavobacterium gillisiae]